MEFPKVGQKLRTISKSLLAIFSLLSYIVYIVHICLYLSYLIYTFERIEAHIDISSFRFEVSKNVLFSLCKN